jgi:hypothetical protein
MQPNLVENNCCCLPNTVAGSAVFYQTLIKLVKVYYLNQGSGIPGVEGSRVFLNICLDSRVPASYYPIICIVGDPKRIFECSNQGYQNGAKQPWGKKLFAEEQ